MRDALGEGSVAIVESFATLDERVSSNSEIIRKAEAEPPPYPLPAYREWNKRRQSFRRHSFPRHIPQRDFHQLPRRARPLGQPAAGAGLAGALAAAGEAVRARRLVGFVRVGIFRNRLDLVVPCRDHSMLVHVRRN